MTNDHPLGDYLADWRRDPFTDLLTLGGLSRDESAELLHERAGRPLSSASVAALHAATNGNPFFLEELVRHLTESDQGDLDVERIELPESVREVVGRRLRRLPEPVTSLLNVAAVCGQEFDATLVAHAAEVPLENVLDAFDAALAARIVDEDATRPGRYLFANALIWQTLYHDMPRARRTRLHARVGSGLEASARHSNTAALLARHFQQALPLVGAEKAIEYTAQAGRDALAEFAFDEAAARFESALRLLEENAPKDTAQKVELLIDRASARASMSTSARA